MNRDLWIDRLTDTCLGECLGGEGPPDLSGRILARAGRSGRLLVFKCAAAAAAALLVAGLISVLGPRDPQERKPAAPSYAAPVVSGDYTVEGDGRIGRGAIVHTDDGTAELSLGGYARVTMRPGSTAQIAGAQNAEEVVLSRGDVKCDVDAAGTRTFAVRTEFGTVSVVGTRFTVQLTGEETQMNGRKMLVNVLAGVVLVTGLNGAQSVVTAGERRAWGRGGARAATARPTATALAEAKTPLEKESVALALQVQALRAKQQEIEAAILAEPDVAAAMKAVFDAKVAYDAALEANPEYADLKQEAEQASTELREAFRGRRGRRGREGREERMKKYRELSARSREAREKMAKLAGEVEGLAELATKKDEVVAAFLTKYQAALAANEDLVEIKKQMEKVDAWSRAASEQRRADRIQRYRQALEERRKKAEEAKDAEQEGKEPDPFGEM